MMRDYHDVILKFVQIIKRHPQVYDSSLESYRTKNTDNAWEIIADSVRAELNEECTVEELKTKWKGIRSSFNRFKNKLHNNTLEGVSCKKYYLYDSLRFLEPFIRPKGISRNAKEQTSKDCSNYTNSDDDDKTRDDYDSEKDTWEINIKSEVTDTSNDIQNTDEIENINAKEINFSKIDHHNIDTIESDISEKNKPKKRKYEDSMTDKGNSEEDLHFFKSILPDIKDFSIKDKRKLKMGILKLIDDIESSREQVKPFHLCNCH